MPTYDYICQDCTRPFEIRATLAEYSKGLRPECPSCNSKKAIRAFTSVNVLTNRRSGSKGACCDPSAGAGCCG